MIIDTANKIPAVANEQLPHADKLAAYRLSCPSGKGA